MVWKSKDKGPTPEEFVALLKKELAPFWYGARPLIGTKGSVAFPLDPVIADKNWFLAFVDPTDFSGETVLTYLKEWHRRYHPQLLEFLLVIPKSKLFSDGPTIEKWIKRLQLPFPVAVDHRTEISAGLSAAFGVAAYPQLVLFQKGRQSHRHEGVERIEDFEHHLQKFFRTDDPGLPLLPIFEPEQGGPKQGLKLDLGRGMGVVFSQPGFSLMGSGFGSGQFPQLSSDGLKSGEVNLSGLWIQDDERIITQDPKASLAIKTGSRFLSILAEVASKIPLSGKLLLEVDGGPVRQTSAGPDLGIDDEGQSSVRIERSGVFRVLENLPPGQHVVRMSFPGADQQPIALYGFRCGD